MRSQLSVCTFVRDRSLGDRLERCLEGDRYTHTLLLSETDFLQHLHQHRQQTDCLVVQYVANLTELLGQLRQLEAFLPIVVMAGPLGSSESRLPTSEPALDTQTQLELTGIRKLYHDAAIETSSEDIARIPSAIEEAIAKFIEISSSADPGNELAEGRRAEGIADNSSTPLKRQQKRLAEKLKERLGYLGVYYKRDPKHFFRRLSHEKQQHLLERLRADYQDIILNYFSDDEKINTNIDDFVNLAFFADISVSQLVEIHMELMEEYSKQLQLEGRNDEILLDYRLTLIDTIAHLCEMYRRSIPRES
ncbi:circadian clock protein KaiA [Roseofilum casamattae]|uniref:Circadian clock oscillator protein KaiA n=1 Tax=Roseofilum casamattae BLCC-M143 TaxID=3022442 RepID=A0ABT7C158_9CYAN|nr:circadian clock protein KaiA [Roseofilum casamattae]MDJ1185192.1 circadian clock protein KaiA [Roseofilum casamattae BLCC-M143]